MFCEVAVSFRMPYKGLVSVNTINKDIVWAILYEAFREQYFEGIAFFLYQPLWGGGSLIGKERKRLVPFFSLLCFSPLATSLECHDVWAAIINSQEVIIVITPAADV